MKLYGPDQLVAGMRAVRGDTIQIASDIPESSYDYRPTPESRSVSETLVHIAWLWNFDRYLHEEAHLDSIEEVDFGAVIAQSRAEEMRQRSKSEIIDLLRTEGERSARWIEQLPDDLLAEHVRMPGGGSTNRFEMLLGTKEHEIQHRSQLMVIQRLLGIVPHFTRRRSDRQQVDATERLAERQTEPRAPSGAFDDSAGIAAN